MPDEEQVGGGALEGAEHHHDHDHDHELIIDRLPTGVWRVDPGASQVNFRTRTIFGLLPVNGYFEGFEGELQVNDQGGTRGALVIQTGTIVTGIHRRDEHLRSPGVFDAQRYPEMVFLLRSIDPGGQDHLVLVGTLRIREVDIPLEFPINAIAHGDHLHIEGRVKIDHYAAGLGWANPAMSGKSARADVALTLNPAS